MFPFLFTSSSFSLRLGLLRFQAGYHKRQLNLVLGCGSTVIFRYYLLGGDTLAPSGLYTRLCRTFLVIFLFCCIFVFEYLFFNDLVVVDLFVLA